MIESRENILFRGKYRAKTTRLPNWDYGANGFYFVTICLKNRECVFGNVIDGKMVLSETGKIAGQFWKAIPEHFPFVIPDEYIIMPDHIHGIIVINKNDDNDNAVIPAPVTVTESETAVVETRQCLVSTNTNTTNTKMNTNTGNMGITNTGIMDNTISETTDSGTNNIKSRFQDQGSRTLSSIIGSYKSVCKKTINRIQNAIDFQWQSRFHDHIIRDERALINIRNYIINNPANWETDEER